MSLVKSAINSIINAKQTQFYKRHNLCSLCGKELNIEVTKSQKEPSIHEKVSCSSCKVTISTNEFSLN